jgi:hypothetical protein
VELVAVCDVPGAAGRHAGRRAGGCPGVPFTSFELLLKLATEGHGGRGAR